MEVVTHSNCVILKFMFSSWFHKVNNGHNKKRNKKCISRRSNWKIFHCYREHNQKLDALSSLLCLTSKTPEDILDVSDMNCYDGNDDIIIVSSEDKQKRRTAKPKRRKRAREILLKFHCRLDMLKIPVLLVRWSVFTQWSQDSVLYNVFVAKGKQNYIWCYPSSKI